MFMIKNYTNINLRLGKGNICLGVCGTRHIKNMVTSVNQKK